MVEKELIEECRRGNMTNFRKLVEISSPLVFSVAFRITGDESTAEDIVQDTMITVWQKIGKIKTTGSFKTWLYRIATNKCYDHLRRRKRIPEYRLDNRDWALLSNLFSADETSQLENEDNARVLNLLTDRLSPKQKTVFILSELEELSADEISEITGMYKSTIKANLYNARRKIELMLKDIVRNESRRG